MPAIIMPRADPLLSDTLLLPLMLSISLPPVIVVLVVLLSHTYACRQRQRDHMIFII